MFALNIKHFIKYSNILYSKIHCNTILTKNKDFFEKIDYYIRV